MPLITSSRQIFVHQGPFVALNTAPFQEAVLRVFRLNEVGQFAAYVPGSKFNNFSVLEPGVGYLIYSVPEALPYQVGDGMQRPDSEQIEYLFTDDPSFDI